MGARLLALRILLVLIALSFVTAAAEEGHGRPFTVKDAIRVVSVQERDGEALHVSPDGKLFFLVEAYGDLVDGSRVFTLKVFGSDPGSLTALTPKVLASTTMRTLTNEDGIRLARWTSDGRAIVFLGVDGEHPSRPYRFDVNDGSLVPLLPDSKQEVVAFDVRDDTCVFIARTQTPSLPSAGWTLTDESMLQILFPDEADEFHEYALFVSRNHGAPRQLTPARRSAVMPYAGLGVSPDAHKMVASLPISDVPKKWERYLANSDGNSTGQPLVNVLQFHLIDLDTGKIRPLVDAPLGFLVRDFSSPRVIWTEDSRIVFLTNTMQPLADEKVASPGRASVLKVNADKLTKPPELVLSYSFLSPGERITALRTVGAGTHADVDIYVPAGERNSPEGNVGKRGVLRLEAKPHGWRVAKKTMEAPGNVSRILGSRVWVAEDANHPPRLMIAREGQEPVQIYDFNPWLSQVQLQPIRQVTWHDKENHVWSGGIALPTSSLNGRKPPLILALKFHDPNKFRPDGPYTTAFATQALVARGYAVLELNSFDPATEGTEKEGPTQVRAVESAINFVASTYNVDSNRVGLIGFSRTSFHVIYSLVNSQKRFAAATISDGVDGGYVQYQLFTLNHYGGSLGKEFADMQGGEPFGTGLDTWRRTAVMFNLDRVKTPLRIGMIGQSSVLQEWELYSSLKLMRKPVEAFWIPGGTHVLVKPRERYVSQQSTVEWFDFWIKGIKSEEPLESDQYLRWELLKNLRQ